MGFGDSEFGFNVSGRGNDSVYVHKDGIKAVGVIRSERTEDTGLDRLAVVDIIKVQREDTSGHEYVAPFVDFRWRVIESS